MVYAAFSHDALLCSDQVPSCPRVHSCGHALHTLTAHCILTRKCACLKLFGRNFMYCESICSLQADLQCTMQELALQQLNMCEKSY